MKNKGVTYAMLIVVALIWYNVFFRVKSNLFGEEEVFVPARTSVPTIASFTRDTFKLKANYRDPFTGVATPVAVSLPVAENPFPAAPAPKPVYREPWPQITYYGQVKKTDSKIPLAILRVDGMQFYLRSGESVFDNYIVRRIYRDSIEIVHGKLRKFVKRGK